MRASSQTYDGPIQREWLATGGLYILEGLVVLVLFSFYRASGKEHVAGSLMSFWGLVFVSALIGVVVLTFVIGRSCYQQWQAGSREWLLGLAMNVLVVGLLILVAEVALRYATVHGTFDEKLGKHLIYPRHWDEVTATYSAVLAKAQQHPTYLIPDNTLGWTVAPNRKSENGMYMSSLEGLRSAIQGVSLKGGTASCRIALVGDSFTFGESVAFEDSWGSQIDRDLQGRCQILNFGVSGYGIDQMYLRYLQDVRPWHPDMVVFGFVSDDLRRTMSTYGFLIFPDGRFPFTKPRFVLKDDQLEVINQPLLPPGETFAYTSIHDLPFINYDVGYERTEWNRPGWEVFEQSYIFRLLTSLYPLHKLERPETSNSETGRLNRALLQKARQAIIDDGAKPLIVFFPTEWDLREDAKEPSGVKILQNMQMAHVDLTPCMKSYLRSTDLFSASDLYGHYSPQGNLQAAKCLIEDIKSMMHGFASP